MALPTLEFDDLVGLIPSPGPQDDKYSRGVVGLIVGSQDYPGAAVLAAEAALHTGVGMGRLCAPVEVETLVLQSRPEIVVAPGKIDSLVVGCGIASGHGEDIGRRLEHFSLSGDVPTVVDAGALLEATQLPGPKILTPHAGELGSLAEALRLPGDTLASWAGALAATWDVVVLLKGHHTQIFQPSGSTYRLPPSTAWLASAGTGDVLAGLLGGLLALGKNQAWDEDRLALFAGAAALIHAEAAARVSLHSGAGRPGPILAKELALALPTVIAACVDGVSPD